MESADDPEMRLGALPIAEANSDPSTASGALVPYDRKNAAPGVQLQPGAPVKLVRLLAMLRSLPEELLWNLAFVGGDIDLLDRFWENLAVPIEDIVEQNPWFPEGIRLRVLAGDVATIRRLVFILLLKLKRNGARAAEDDFGIILERAADGTIERQLPTLKADLERSLRLHAPEEVRLQLLGCQAEPVKEDTSRYFERCDPWHIRLLRFCMRQLPGPRNASKGN